MMTFERSKSIEILSRTPTVLTELLSGLSDDWVRNNEGENTWSPYEVVGHLIHGEKTDWIPRTQIILSNVADKTFVPFDRFAQSKEPQDQSIEVLLEEFSILRKQNIKQLNSFQLDEEMLARTGIHPELGEVTLKALLSTWVVHDLGHIAQITRVMAKQYHSEVGPWIQYLGVLK